MQTMGISLAKNSSADNRPKDEIRVAFYMRVSTAEQELGGYSPEFQKDQLLDHVRRKEYRGWTTQPEWHFFDVGSGSELDGRPQLHRLLGLVRAGAIDIVLVWKIDRLSRSLSDLLRLFDEFNRHRVGFASTKEDLDFTGPIGRLIYQVFGALAEFERETIKMRTEEGRKASALAGNYTGSVAPYGYRGVPNPGGKGRKLAVVPAEAAVVRRVFGWFVHDGWSAARIAAELNRLQVPKATGNRTIQGTKWHEFTVRSMLASEEYRGVFITNRYRLVQKRPRRHVERPKSEWIVVRMPSVIDDMLFYLAQERLRATAKNPRVGGGAERYLLRGKLVEAGSGRGFVGYKSAKGTRNYRRKQYAAAGAYRPSISVAARPLETFVWAHVERAIRSPDEFLRVHREQVELGQEKDQLVAKLRFYEDQLSEVNRKIDKVNEDYYAERIGDAERQDWLARYRDQRDAAFAGKRAVEADLSRLGRHDLACEQLREFAANFRADAAALGYDEKAALVEMLVERVEISDTPKGRHAKVLYRFDPKEIAVRMSGVEPVFRFSEPKTRPDGAVSECNGGSDGQGYFLFAFETPIGFLGNNQYRTLPAGQMQPRRDGPLRRVTPPESPGTASGRGRRCQATGGSQTARTSAAEGTRLRSSPATVDPRICTRS